MLSPVREGKRTPLVCPDCGCRLNLVTLNQVISFAHHFGVDVLGGEYDARGCKCPSIGKTWMVDSDKVRHLTV